MHACAKARQKTSRLVALLASVCVFVCCATGFAGLAGLAGFAGLIAAPTPAYATDANKTYNTWSEVSSAVASQL
ncbi:hypothetical protein QP311_25600, partial [Escherichia coli]|nr:hypothetical protein [Escherichia coli]